MIILKRPCTTYLLQIYKEVFCKNKSSETFKQNPWKIPKSNFLEELIILNH